ncbi:MAG: geranylgeranylglyceryl/heptaprenylglyceryl phosphate synthase, partial [Candidatus Hadarchaeales archaeon]
KRDGAAHLTLIDPAKQKPNVAGEIAKDAEIVGTDGIMVGGSTKATGEILDDTILAIKHSSKLPVILFPAGESGISHYADAIFFMSMLNSRDPYFITRAQMRGAPLVKKFGLEPIPMAYLLIEPGGTAGKVGKAELIPRDSPETAAAYALAAQYFGMRFVYLEAGSGAKEPVPVEMVKAVKKEIEIPLIVGGGIRTPDAAEKIVTAGADIIVTGTIVEKAADRATELKGIIDAVKKAGKKPT